MPKVTSSYVGQIRCLKEHFARCFVLYSATIRTTQYPSNDAIAAPAILRYFRKGSNAPAVTSAPDNSAHITDDGAPSPRRLSSMTELIPRIAAAAVKIKAVGTAVPNSEPKTNGRAQGVIRANPKLRM